MKDLLEKLDSIIFDLRTRVSEMKEFFEKSEEIIKEDDREKLNDIISLFKICHSILGEVMKATWPEVMKKEEQEIDKLLKQIFRDVRNG